LLDKEDAMTDRENTHEDVQIQDENAAEVRVTKLTRLTIRSGVKAGIVPTPGCTPCHVPGTRPL
jgi:hypothetical protein